jgi:hypothetical protein
MRLSSCERRRSRRAAYWLPKQTRGKGALMGFARSPLWLVVFVGLCGCSQVQVVENTPSAVSVRYDGIVQSLEDATAAAQKACAAHGKTARLRSTEMIATIERFAHFDCVSS